MLRFFFLLLKLTPKYSTETIEVFRERSRAKYRNFSCFLDTEFYCISSTSAEIRHMCDLILKY